jgi:hypothetical protein
LASRRGRWIVLAVVVVAVAVVAYHRGELDAAQLDVLVHRLVAAHQ